MVKALSSHFLTCIKHTYVFEIKKEARYMYTFILSLTLFLL